MDGNFNIIDNFLIYIERSKFFSSEKRVFFNGHRWQLVKESDRSSPVHVSQILVALRIEAGNALGVREVKELVSSIKIEWRNGKLISKKVC
ncbi:unnamed protein product [Rhizophagus irregularis]|uniref:Uncharacterized protein n=1 Tax=Rhizophagus irregularis TaxID=588596 RepID=A0A916E960_9GLOM|nr:hypothetical protein RIR_jg36293.t2 [Rhizophagus irregularis DAOM 181602=DAOM 197198]CAB4489305.1 unnamed protein product [Rhizophagus irregularis]CAB5370321.1 unnamed protein product [Rhizophagus irregularis]